MRYSALTYWSVLLLIKSVVAEEVVIVTSFPKDLFETYKSAFESSYPDTELVFRSKKTSAAVTYIRETAKRPNSDIFWASAVDAFALLKKEGLLTPYTLPTHLAAQIPDKVGDYPVHDPDSYFSGCALSGYGIMWNKEYLKAYKLDPPKEWSDLTNSIYYSHLAMSSPSRSGTTHLPVEAILQGCGWKKGWALLLQMAGNMSVITERSFGVPQGIASGEFGIGVVVDFFGLSAVANGQPVAFVYPSITPMVPANIALIKGGPNLEGAKRFINFTLSQEGQKLLFSPQVSRLPVVPNLYDQAPAGFLNPFKMSSPIRFDVNLSQQRYDVINALFDWFVTFRLKELKQAWKEIYKAEVRLAKKRDRGQEVAQQQNQLLQAKSLASQLPVEEILVNSPDFNQNWSEASSQYEQQWDQLAKVNYNQARKMAKSIK